MTPPIAQQETNTPDQGVDLGGLDVVELLDGVLDVPLVGLQVDDENKGVVVLNLLHGTLSVERVVDGSELVESGQVGDRLSGVFRSSGKSEGLGSVEGDGCSDLSERVGRSALESGLLSGFRLGVLGFGSGWGLVAVRG